MQYRWAIIQNKYTNLFRNKACWSNNARECERELFLNKERTERSSCVLINDSLSKKHISHQQPQTNGTWGGEEKREKEWILLDYRHTHLIIPSGNHHNLICVCVTQPPIKKKNSVDWYTPDPSKHPTTTEEGKHQCTNKNIGNEMMYIIYFAKNSPQTDTRGGRITKKKQKNHEYASISTTRMLVTLPWSTKKSRQRKTQVKLVVETQT